MEFRFILLFSSALVAAVAANEPIASRSNAMCGPASSVDGQCKPFGAYNKVSVGNATACCAACAEDASKCQSWVFRKDQSTKGCHLHSDPLGTTKAGSCTSGPTSPAPPPAPPAPPLPRNARNLLYIVVDDLRTEIMYTDKRKGLVTPAIDALAAKGTVFTRAYVQQGVCSPSRNSFLSGRRPDTTQVWNFKNSFRETLGKTVSSWPGAFKNAGYTTVGLGKVYHPGHPSADDGSLSWSLDKFPYFHPSGFVGKISDEPDSKFQDGMSTDTAILRLQALAKGMNSTDAKPFFLAVGLHKPHIPWVMPQRFLDMQTPEAEVDIATTDTPPQGYCNVSLYICDNGLKLAGGSGLLPWQPPPKAGQQKARREYRAAVSWTDNNVGRLLAELDSLGLSDSTAIVFHGDHGWHLGEHGVWCKQSNFELVARVPLIVYVPWLSQSHGKKTGALVEMVDLMPTTLELMGINARVADFDQLEGSSFLPLLKSPDTAENEWKNATFTQYPRCSGSASSLESDGGKQLPWDFPTDNACTGVASSGFDAMGLSIRTLTWRYTLWLKWNKKTLSPEWNQDQVGEELYDHTDDAGDETDKFETINLATSKEHAVVKSQLREQLKMGWKPARPPSSARAASLEYV